MGCTVGGGERAGGPKKKKKQGGGGVDQGESEWGYNADRMGTGFGVYLLSAGD